MSPLLLRDLSDDGVLTLTLNRPDKRNALNGELVEALKDALAEVAGKSPEGAGESREAPGKSPEAPDVRVVALRGAGKDFCAGADLAELERIAEKGPEESLADAQSLGDLFLAMRALPCPVVAIVHGRALAGGCGLATACDLVLAHEDAELGYPEVHLGFVPAMVMALLRRKTGESRAFELVALGERVSADRAREAGLVNRVLPADAFEESVDRYLADLVSRPPSALMYSKRLLYDLDDMGVEEGVRRGAEVNAHVRLTDACREGVRRFLEKGR